MDLKRNRITGKAIPVRGNDIDTDRIIPARFLRCVTFEGIGEHAFEDDRKQLREKGKQHPFDDPRFAEAEILAVNNNFGCGSSREHAPQALMRWNHGIKAIVGESFAEIFLGNCAALGIPCVMAEAADVRKVQDAAESQPATVFTLNLESRTLAWDGESISVSLNDGMRKGFIEGRWDTTAELLADKEAIAATAGELPYFNHWK